MLKTALDFLRFSHRRFDKTNKILFFSVAVTAALSLVSAVIMPIFQRDLIESVQADIVNHQLMIAMLSVSFAVIFCVIFESFVLNRLTKNLANRLQKEMIASAVRYSSKVITTRGSGAFMSVSVFGDNERVSGLLDRNYFSLVLVFVQALFIMIIATTWSWVFSAVVAPIYVLSVLAILITNKIHLKHWTLARENVMKVNPKILERLENRLSMLGFADVSAVEAEVFNLLDERDTRFLKANIASDLSETITKALQAVGLIALFLLSMTQISAGHLGIASFVAMLAYYAGIFAPLSAVQKLTQGAGIFKVYLDRNKDDLTKTPVICLPKSCELKFDECTFVYDEGDAGQITNLSMNIDRRIGLVGLSGEGKTTIIKILLGNVLPQKGACLLGETEIPSVAKGVLHSMIKLYSQDLEIFDDTLDYNITLGKTPLSQTEYSKAVFDYEAKFHDELARIEKNKPLVKNCSLIKELFLLNDWQITDSELLHGITAELRDKREMLGVFCELAAARKYYISERYQSLTEDLGLHHLSGRSFGQHGKNVSGGEKSKICLARFLLPVQKGFYVIDEPFTNVDAISEEQCISAVQKYLDCKGGITISHKLNIIRALSDDIVVLNKGEICERGTHNELLQNKGFYAELYSKFVELK